MKDKDDEAATDGNGHGFDDGAEMASTDTYCPLEKRRTQYDTAPAYLRCAHVAQRGGHA